MKVVSIIILTIRNTHHDDVLTVDVIIFLHHMYIGHIMGNE